MGVALFDPVSKIGGMAHVMLPEVNDCDSRERPGKYANTAIPSLLDTMERLGAERSRIVAAVAGGAQVCFGNSVPKMLALGSRNTIAVQKELEHCGVRCVAADVGGSQGRTFSFESGTGMVTVRTTTSADKVLCRFELEW
jgi:chemotaxis protein CheD